MKLILSIFLLLLTTPTLASTEWVVQETKDEMTGKSQVYAISSSVSPTKTLDFPYSDLKSYIGVGCESGKLWVYAGFTIKNNITHDNGVISTRIKWDDDISNIKLSTEPASKAVYFPHDNLILKKLVKSNKLLIEYPWYGEGNIYFNYPLKGSNVAIKKIAELCGISIDKESLYDHLTWELSNDSPIEKYDLGFNGKAFIIKATTWKINEKNTKAIKLIEKALILIEQVSNKYKINYELFIKVTGSAVSIDKYGKTREYFQAVELNNLLSQALNSQKNSLSKVKEIALENRYPLLYGSDAEYEILEGTVKKAYEQIEIQIITPPNKVKPLNGATLTKKVKLNSSWELRWVANDLGYYCNLDTTTYNVSSDYSFSLHVKDDYSLNIAVASLDFSPIKTPKIKLSSGELSFDSDSFYDKKPYRYFSFNNQKAKLIFDEISKNEKYNVTIMQENDLKHIITLTEPSNSTAALNYALSAKMYCHNLQKHQGSYGIMFVDTTQDLMVNKFIRGNSEYDRSGVVIMGVHPDKKAYQLGFKTFDIVLGINGIPVTRANFGQVMGEEKSKDSQVIITILRGSQLIKIKDI